MFRKLINYLANHIRSSLSEDILYKIQRIIVDAGLFIKTEELIAVIIVLMIIVFITTLTFSLIFNTSLSLSVFTTILVPVLLIFYVYYKNEKRLEEIELELPDYLRQLSSLIKVGLGLESALNELTKTVNNSLNDEIKRALLETSFGRPFDEALMDIANRNTSDNLKHSFGLIIHSWYSGGNLSEVLESMANDLSDTIMLKKERKAGVMMSVMFLIISSVVATPFCLGMIRLYTDFISKSGRTNPLTDVIPISSMGYVIIQSVLVSILIGIVMYSDSKKGIKYILVLVPLSILVYYISQMFLNGIMGV
ncbi:MAG: hypothetical protein BZ138_05165 [Methanosphaera sp. rholeuAM270]|nr:MAG: hypothetical protein BZ138_05165 [Methanosphaera sp. rholeuAM270]